MNRCGPLFFQFFKTTARVVTKTVLHLKSVLDFEKLSILFIKLGLIELLDSMQDLLKGFVGINQYSPLAVADDKLVHRLAAMNLALAGTQTTEEGFQVIVSAVTFRPDIAGKEPRPTLPEGGTDMCDHRCFRRVGLGVLFQSRQEFFDLAFDFSARRVRLPFSFRGIEAMFQFDQPLVLTFETPIRLCKRAAPLNHSPQVVQYGMAPFLRLRWSEASNRAKSSNTRRPPSAKGGLLPSVSVIRIKSA